MSPKFILSNYFLPKKNMLQSLFLKIPNCTYFVINMCALFSHKFFLHFLKKKFFFLENMILVESLKVELDFRVLAPNSIYSIFSFSHSVSTLCSGCLFPHDIDIILPDRNAFNILSLSACTFKLSLLTFPLLLL